MTKKKYSIYGIENPLLDFIAYVDEAFLESTGAPCGSSGLISLERKEELLAQIKEYENIPGGSCANTIRGIAWLSKYAKTDQAVYGGAVGKDPTGEKYIRLMKEDYDIRTVIPQKEKNTGISIVLVTPDCERTMFTYLGACEDFSETDIEPDAIRDSKIFHTTGYMWGLPGPKQAMEKSIAHARANGCLVSFDLADPFVVKFNRDTLMSYIPANTDFLFGNKEEISMMLDMTGEDDYIAEKAEILAKTVIVKVGARGCYVNDRGRIFSVPGKKVNAIDTVGAGDSFAAGYLYGVINDFEPRVCAEIANNLAAGIVTVSGCNYFKLDQKKVLGDYVK
jgi:sugar/nucleoside kinase (ribokinase family)